MNSQSKAFRDGKICGRKFSYFSFRVADVTQLNRLREKNSPGYSDGMLEHYNLEEIQKTYLKILVLERKYLGRVTKETRDLVKRFERTHLSLCEYITYKLAGRRD